MTDPVIPDIPPAPVVPPYPALGAPNFNQMAYDVGTSMPGVVSGLNAIAAAARECALAASAYSQIVGDAVSDAEEAASTATTKAGESEASAAAAAGSQGAASASAANAAGSAAAAAGSEDEAAGHAAAAAGFAAASGSAKTGAEAARDAAQGYRDQSEVFATQQLVGHSTTSVTPGAGAKSFTIEASRSFVVGMYLVATSASDPNTRMSGYVQSYNGTTGALTLTVDAFSGSTAKADWVIGVAAPGGSSAQSLTYVPVPGAAQAAVSGARYGLQSTAKTTVTLPATPTNGDVIAVVCDNLRRDNVIARNGQLLMGVADDLQIDNPYFPVQLQYQQPYGWRLIS